MTGVDLALPLLEDARLKAAERNLEITWEHRDMRDLPWTHTFDGAICFGESFGFFDDCNNLKFVEAIFKTLKPGGKFFLDVLAAEVLFPRFQERSWHTAGDILVVSESKYDHVEGRVNTTWTIVQNGRLETKSSSMHIYTYHELHNLLRKTGFCRVESYGSLEGDSFTLGSRRLYLVAMKPC